MSSNHELPPIVIFAYQRVDSLKLILQRVKGAQLGQVYVFLDKPPENHDQSGHIQVKNLVRSYANKYGWVVKERKRNYGLKKNILAGLNEIFRFEQSAIILEDDCVPAKSFFRYCTYLLQKHAEDEIVMCINGSNLVSSKSTSQKYLFSRYPSSWGWATWKRAWQQYDEKMDRPKDRSEVLQQVFGKDWLSRMYWSQIFKLVDKNVIDTWDYQWTYSVWRHRGLSVVPKVNLIENVGFDNRAVHTRYGGVRLRKSTGELTFPLRGPKNFTVDKPYHQQITKVSYLNLLTILGMIRASVKGWFI